MKSPIFALVLIPVFAVFISLSFQVSYFWGVLLFYLAPGIYIAFRFRKRKNALKPALFSIITAIPFTIIVDYIGTASNLWNVPHTLFPLFLNLLPIEDFLWMASAIFTIVMVSGVADEIQIEIQPETLRSRFARFFTSNMKKFMAGSIVALGIFFLFYRLYGQDFFTLDSPYLYIIVASIFFLLPVIALMYHLPKFSRRHIFTVGYFFSLTVLFESVAVYHSWWEFNGAYFLPPLTVSGKALPLEELFFVGIVGACLAILLYKFLLDFRKR